MQVEQPLELTRPGVPMFGGAPWQEGVDYDCVFLGVPSDLGTLGLVSPACGPSTLRTTSTVLGHPRDQIGWYDYAQDRVLLKGARLADVGDVAVDKTRGQAQLNPLPRAISQIAERSKMVCVMGGDDSIVYWCARAFPGQGLLLLDAHEDASPPEAELPNHANWVTYLERTDEVRPILQYGLRGMRSATARERSSWRHTCRSFDEIIHRFRAAGVTSITLGIDVDVFGPEYVGAVVSPSPGGIHPDSILPLVEQLVAADLSVQMLVMTEFAPQSIPRDTVAAMALDQLLLRILDICLAPKS